jgi:hypothetical protein
VAVNPWLAGRLRRADNGRTVLWIPDKPNADDCFRVAEDNKLELGQVRHRSLPKTEASVEPPRGSELGTVPPCYGV